MSYLSSLAVKWNKTRGMIIYYRLLSILLMGSMPFTAFCEEGGTNNAEAAVAKQETDQASQTSEKSDKSLTESSVAADKAIAIKKCEQAVIQMAPPCGSINGRISATKGATGGGATSGQCEKNARKTANNLSSAIGSCESSVGQCRSACSAVGMTGKCDIYNNIIAGGKRAKAGADKAVAACKNIKEAFCKEADKSKCAQGSKPPSDLAAKQKQAAIQQLNDEYEASLPSNVSKGSKIDTSSLNGDTGYLPPEARNNTVSGDTGYVSPKAHDYTVGGDTGYVPPETRELAMNSGDSNNFFGGGSTDSFGDESEAGLPASGYQLGGDDDFDIYANNSNEPPLPVPSPLRGGPALVPPPGPVVSRTPPPAPASIPKSTPPVAKNNPVNSGSAGDGSTSKSSDSSRKNNNNASRGNSNSSNNGNGNNGGSSGGGGIGGSGASGGGAAVPGNLSSDLANTNRQIGSFESQSGNTSSGSSGFEKTKKIKIPSALANKNQDTAEAEVVDRSGKAVDGKKSGANTSVGNRLIASTSAGASASSTSDRGSGSIANGNADNQGENSLSAEEEANKKMGNGGFWGSVKNFFSGRKRTWGKKDSLYKDKKANKKLARSGLESPGSILNRMKDQMLASRGHSQMRGIASTHTGVTDRNTSLFKSMCMSYHNYQVNNDINMGQTWCPKK